MFEDYYKDKIKYEDKNLNWGRKPRTNGRHILTFGVIAIAKQNVTGITHKLGIIQNKKLLIA